MTKTVDAIFTVLWPINFEYHDVIKMWIEVMTASLRTVRLKTLTTVRFRLRGMIGSRRRDELNWKTKKQPKNQCLPDYFYHIIVQLKIFWLNAEKKDYFSTMTKFSNQFQVDDKWLLRAFCPRANRMLWHGNGYNCCLPTIRVVDDLLILSS